MRHSGTTVFMQTIPEKPLYRKLFSPLKCPNQDGTMGYIPVGFESDGSSTPILLQGIFPRHRHPIAFFRHDYRCGRAKNKTERAWADQEFRKDVARTSCQVTAWVGYVGVRIGALLGIGNNF